MVMKYTLREKPNGAYELLRYGKPQTSQPNNIEVEFWLEIEQMREILDDCFDIINNAILHGMPVTEKVAKVSNFIRRMDKQGDE